MTGGGRARQALCAVLVCVSMVATLLAPTAAWAAAPVTTLTEPPAGPSDGRGTQIPGVDGWWIAPPWLTLTSDQTGTMFWRWDSEPETAQAVTGGVPLSITDAPEGDHTLFAFAANSVGETETPGLVRRFIVDSQEPSQPGGFSATLLPGVGVQLVWTASTDPAPASGVGGYRVYRKTGLPPFTSGDAIGSTGAGTLAYLDPVTASVDDYIYAVRAVDVAGNEGYLTEIDPTPTLLPVFRFFNFRKGTHFYTASDSERAQVIANLGWTFTYEGVAYQANGTATGAVPLHRFFNTRNGTHFYTASEDERRSIVANLGWTYRYEGIAYYVLMNPVGTTAVHRFYNFRAGTHFYTASEAERQKVQATLGRTYRYEGIAYYVLR